MTHQKAITPASLLACLFLVVAGIAGVALADGDDGTKIHVVERHKVQLKLDGDLEVIEVDDLAIGESRQFFTDSGKEVVVTRNQDGIDVTVDGEELELPKMIHVETLAEKIQGDDVKVIVRSGTDDNHGVWISDEGAEKHVVIHRLDDGREMHWVSGEGAEIHGLRIETSAAEFLDEKGVLDGLDAAQREAILEALEEYDSQRVRPRAFFFSKDEEN